MLRGNASHRTSLVTTEFEKHFVMGAEAFMNREHFYHYEVISSGICYVLDIPFTSTFRIT